MTHQQRLFHSEYTLEGPVSDHAYDHTRTRCFLLLIPARVRLYPPFSAVTAPKGACFSAAKSFRMATSAARKWRSRCVRRAGVLRLNILTAHQIFKQKDESARAKMKKQVQAMESTGHRNILKTYDSFDAEPDGTFYVVSPARALRLCCSCRRSLHSTPMLTAAHRR